MACQFGTLELQSVRISEVDSGATANAVAGWGQAVLVATGCQPRRGVLDSHASWWAHFPPPHAIAPGARWGLRRGMTAKYVGAHPALTHPSSGAVC